MISYKKLIFCCLLLALVSHFSGTVFAFGRTTITEQKRAGNLALPSSQQPGPLVSFGQNMLDQHDIQFFSYFRVLNGENKQYLTLLPTLLYGVKNNFSVYARMPIAGRYQLGDQVEHGLQDLIIQLEWAFYEKFLYDATNQISIVAQTTFPTGSVSFEKLVGFGGYGYKTQTIFLGFTASHMGRSWYPFISSGFRVVTKKNCTKVGNQFLCQAGLGRNIASWSNGFIANILFELDGKYVERAINRGMVDCNSGGSQIIFGPSCWVSTRHISFQAGISWVIYEHLFGDQPKNNYYIFTNLGCKF